MDDLRQTTDDDFYQRVLPQLNVLEDVRKAKKKVYEWRKRIAMFICPIVLPITAYADWLLLTIQRSSDDSGAGISVAVGGAIWWWVTQPKRQYAKAYKDEILPKIARLFGNLTYKAGVKIPMDTLKPFRIVPHHDRYEVDDYFAGAYRGTDVQFTEVDLKVRRQSGKRTRYVTVFKGLMILIRLPRVKFAGHTVMVGNGSSVTQWFKEKSLGLDRADLVDPEFEKQFDVYTNDQVESRYLIHPAMIEKIKAIRATYAAKGVMAAYFMDSLLLLLPSSKNHFEPAGIDTPATEPSTLVAMKHEVEQVLNLIDQMEQYDKDAAHRAA